MYSVVDDYSPVRPRASCEAQFARISARAKSRSPVALRSVRTIVMSMFLVCIGVTAGCGRPQGMLFPQLDPPRVWPPPPDTPRIKLLGILSDSRDLNAGQSGMEVIKAAFRGPRPPVRFSGPHGLAVRNPGVLAIADPGGGSVHLIDLDSRSHHMVSGFGDQRFAAPVGAAWAGERLFVTDAQRHEVIELDSVGGFRQRFGSDVLKRPVGIAYVPKRRQLYVVDGNAHHLTVFDLAGKLIKTIGQRGTAPGEFNFPTHICSAGDRFLVADSGNFRVQLLDLDGHCVKTIGQKGDGAGDLSLPKGVAFDGDGHVYVIDAHFENIQIFDEVGQLLMAFGEEGSDPGKFSLPAGLAIDDQDRIWVADSGNHRVQVFEYMRTSS